MEKAIPLRLFRLVRDEDVHNFSGTGVVGAGVQLPSGECVMQWTSTMKSTTFYPSKEVLEAIHGHDGKSRVEWISPPIDAGSAPRDETENASKMKKVFLNFPTS